jgi:hypothetical protein
LIERVHGYLRIIKGFRSPLCVNPSRAVAALIVAPTCLAFATGASAAAGLPPIHAAKCLQWQYHGQSGAETALRAEREAAAGRVVSPTTRQAVSRIRGIQIDAPILTKNCRSIASRIAGRNHGSAAAHSGSNMRLDIAVDSHAKVRGTQYQVPRIWYQSRYAKLGANGSLHHPVAIEAVATKSAQAPPARPNAQGNVRDTRVMVKIGLLLGLGYLLFLTLWFWATRLRPRPTRADRSIDTGRRIE